MLTEIESIIAYAEEIQRKLYASNPGAFRECASAAQVDGSAPQDPGDLELLVYFVSSRSEPYRIDFRWINLSFIAKTKESLQKSMQDMLQNADFITRTLTRPNPRHRIEVHADMLRTFPRPSPL